MPFETLVERHSPEDHELYVALEHARQNAARAEIVATARQLGYRLASYVAPTAEIGNEVVVGEHSLILESVVAQYRVRIGDNAIVGAKCFFGQEVEVGANSYFGSSVFVDRFARIGSHCVLGSQARVGESVTIADWSFIRAFEHVPESLRNPTLIHAKLSAPGYVIDRRNE